jgi:hypothetical protein
MKSNYDYSCIFCECCSLNGFHKDETILIILGPCMGTTQIILGSRVALRNRIKQKMKGSSEYAFPPANYQLIRLLSIA